MSQTQGFQERVLPPLERFPASATSTTSTTRDMTVSNYNAFPSTAMTQHTSYTYFPSNEPYIASSQPCSTASEDLLMRSVTPIPSTCLKNSDVTLFCHFVDVLGCFFDILNVERFFCVQTARTSLNDPTLYNSILALSAQTADLPCSVSFRNKAHDLLRTLPTGTAHPCVSTLLSFYELFDRTSNFRSPLLTSSGKLFGPGQHTTDASLLNMIALHDVIVSIETGIDININHWIVTPPTTFDSEHGIVLSAFYLLLDVVRYVPFEQSVGGTHYSNRNEAFVLWNRLETWRKETLYWTNPIRVFNDDAIVINPPVLANAVQFHHLARIVLDSKVSWMDGKRDIYLEQLGQIALGITYWGNKAAGRMSALLVRAAGNLATEPRRDALRTVLMHYTEKYKWPPKEMVDRLELDWEG